MLDFEKMNIEELREIIGKASNQLNRIIAGFLVEHGCAEANILGQRETMNFILVLLERLRNQRSPVLPARRLESIEQEFQDWWNCYDQILQFLPNDKPEQVSSEDIVDKHLTSEGVSRGIVGGVDGLIYSDTGEKV